MTTDRLPAVLRLAAFPAAPNGGNPAGVVIDADARDLDDHSMREIAAKVGYSETAFVVDGPIDASRRHYKVRYFSPEVEVPFCGHATIALAVAIATRIGPGPLTFKTLSGPISVDTLLDLQGQILAALTSAMPEHRTVPRSALSAALTCLGWTEHDLDPRIPPAVAYAGARHLILSVAERSLLTAMRYDFNQLQRLSQQNSWVTLQLGYMQTSEIHHVRAPFPFGGVYEDPATGAGAAAYAAYLRNIGVIAAPIDIQINQGEDMGRPSRIQVAVPPSGPVTVAGTATVIST